MTYPITISYSTFSFIAAALAAVVAIVATQKLRENDSTKYFMLLIGSVLASIFFFLKGAGESRWLTFQDDPNAVEYWLVWGVFLLIASLFLGAEWFFAKRSQNLRLPTTTIAGLSLTVFLIAGLAHASELQHNNFRTSIDQEVSQAERIIDVKKPRWQIDFTSAGAAITSFKHELTKERISLLLQNLEQLREDIEKLETILRELNP